MLKTYIFTSILSCSVAWPPLRVHPLSNVYFQVQDPSHIITANITYYNQTKTVSFNRQSALPEKVYLVCGDQAYSCFPRESHHRCYQAFLVPLIREVSKTEYWTRDKRSAWCGRVGAFFEGVWPPVIHGYILLSHTDLSIVMFLIAIFVITCMIGLIRKQCTKTIVTAMQIDLYPIPDWIPPYDDVDLGTQLK